MIFQIKKRDIIFSLIFGELTSWLLIFIIKNPYIEEFQKLTQLESLFWLFLVIFPIIFLLGLIIGGILSGFNPTIFQLTKFLETGLFNTFIDIGILNLLIWLSGITSGWGLLPLNTISFLGAATNSYFWNRFWTFKKEGRKTGKEYLRFLGITAVGWGINTSIVVLGTTFFIKFSFLSVGAWLNFIKILATFISMTWNFVGYKFLVFKR